MILYEYICTYHVRTTLDCCLWHKKKGVGFSLGNGVLVWRGGPCVNRTNEIFQGRSMCLIMPTQGQQLLSLMLEPEPVLPLQQQVLLQIAMETLLVLLQVWELQQQ